MVQGTGSSVGKSLMATALCRIFRQDGYSVAPFKAQNMSLNSFVTPAGAEIGRSQAVQAEAAGVLPSTEMNPVLLKPEVDYRSQLVVMGRPVGHLESKNFNRRKDGLWDVVAGALDRLRDEFDVVVIEGAGSPAEINLRQGDIVNMEVALHASSPVLLVGDIDKGGVFASVYGTVMLLAPEERDLIKGVIINKFRGDVSILRPGLSQLEELTGVSVLGVVPYMRELYVPEEDSPSDHRVESRDASVLDVAVIGLPHIANFDDFDPIARETGVGLRYVRTRAELGRPDLLIVPGTKTTVSDLRALRESGLGDAIAVAAETAAVVGICGGYQMLGQWIIDEEGVESRDGRVRGLGLLQVSTRFASRKQTHQVTGTVTAGDGLLEGAAGLELEGYEIHMGETSPEEPAYSDSAPFELMRRSGEDEVVADGFMGHGGWVVGTYVHGLFHNTDLRRSILARVAERKGAELTFTDDEFSQSAEYNRLAETVRDSLDMDELYRIVGLRGG